ncbi:PEP-CTERM protein-sorting domain-containing protein [Nitrosospira briensis]|uniref:PEP-CTERM protein-sorting domain-containing protein n=1 Tax=Nitrosospira briensis TaxID=35799 RepID=A0A1I4Y161_9PROT|nr:PEP-CTERM sorting domain-containing protein [Nitrosospira briensis]SFN31814.1 PEP-CTERM protein-sorting domain-containing protein [Nitrosospira briensis]
MNKMSKVVIAALAFGGSISTASAAGVITDVTASGGGTFNLISNTTDPNVLDLSKTFNSLDPMVLTFTVGHIDGDPGNPYTVTEAITNNTGQSWVDFHFSIQEPDQGQGVVFTEHNNSTLSSFTLDPEPSTGSRNLNFTGNLANDGIANASFMLSPFDPGAGNTTTFTLTQVPTIPEPETYAMLLAGLGLMGVIARRRNNKQS